MATLESIMKLVDLAQSPEQVAWREQYAAEIEQAREDYEYPANDDLEIDDFPILSPSDDGVWVGAWVWVAKKEQQDD